MLEFFIGFFFLTAILLLLLELLLLCLAFHRGPFTCAIVKLLIPLLPIIKVLVIAIDIRRGRFAFFEHAL